MREILGIHVDAKDTCVTVADEVHRGDVVKYYCEGGKEERVVSKDDIPIYHKIAIVPHACDDKVIKYGYPIGVALKEIEIGQHVHIHNIRAVGLKVSKKGALNMSSAELSK